MAAVGCAGTPALLTSMAGVPGSGKVPGQTCHEACTPGAPRCAAAGERRQEHAIWRLCLVALPMLSLWTTGAVLIPNSTPYLLSLGLRPAMATLNNMAGPVMGFLVGPVVGAVSDRLTSPYGRRRPVIFAGLVATWASALLYGGSSRLLSQDKAAWLAMASLWALDGALNVLLVPQRALVADMASDSQQVWMQLVFTVMQGIGMLLGYSLSHLCEVAAEHMLEVLVAACVLNTLAVAVQFSFACETPLQATAQGPAAHSLCAPLTSSVEGLWRTPWLVRHLGGVNLLVWIGATYWLSFAGQWFSISVYRGDPRAPQGSKGRQAYVAGQGQFCLAGQCRSIVHSASALLIMLILRRTSVPPRLVYAATIALGSLANFAAAFWVRQDGTLALVCMAVSVLPYAASSAIPYGLVAHMNRLAERQGQTGNMALHAAVLNCCNNLGQQIATLILAGVEARVSVAHALPLTFAVGAVAELFGCVGLVFLDDDLKKEQGCDDVHDDDECSDDEHITFV